MAWCGYWLWKHGIRMSLQYPKFIFPPPSCADPTPWKDTQRHTIMSYGKWIILWYPRPKLTSICCFFSTHHCQFLKWIILCHDAVCPKSASFVVLLVCPLTHYHGQVLLEYRYTCNYSVLLILVNCNEATFTEKHKMFFYTPICLTAISSQYVWEKKVNHTGHILE